MEKNDDLLNTVFNYFRKERLLVNEKKFSYQLASHPNFPDISALVDTLNQFNINFGIYETSISDIDKKAQNFIALLKQRSGKSNMSFVEFRGDNFRVDSNTISAEDLEAKWIGIILLLEKNTKLKNKWLKQQVLKGSLFLIMIFLLLVVSNYKITIFLFYILPVSGVILSVLTLKNVFSITNKISDKVCNASLKTDCDAVVSSKKWRLFRILDFSDLALTFFSSQLLSMFFLSLFDHDKEFFNVLGIVIVLSTPLIFTSLYYQKYIEKKWCPLCLGIICIVVLEFVFILWFHKTFYTFSFNSTLLISSVFLLVFLLWKYIKNLLATNQKFINRDIKRNQLLYNYQMFNSILKSGKYIDYRLDHINIRKLHSPLNITLVTDPFCDYCKAMHDELTQFSINHGIELSWNTIFNVDIDDEPDIVKDIYRTMMHLQIVENDSVFLEAEHEWYFYENEHKWLAKYSKEKDVNYIDSVLKNQRQWCLEQNINFTPALFINGYLFPRIYEVDDLQYFIEDLYKDKETN